MEERESEKKERESADEPLYFLFLYDITSILTTIIDVIAKAIWPKE